MGDAQGNFQIASLASNLTFTVVVAARGFEPATLSRVDPLRSPLAVQLAPRLPGLLSAQRTVLGRVLDRQKRPVLGAVVSINGLTTGNRTSFDRLPPGTDVLAVSDAAGEFEICCPLPFDAVGLRIDAPGLARQKHTRIPPGGRRRDFVLPAGAALIGRVTRDGRPVKGLNVGVASVDRGVDNFTGGFVVGTGEDGVFVFPNLPAERDYQFYGVMDSLRGLGARPARVVRVGRDGSKTDLGPMALQPGWRVAGEVRLAEGKPLPPGARLILDRDEAWDFSVIDLPVDGRFDLPNVPGEAVSLGAGIEGYRALAGQPKLGRLASDRTALVLIMEPGK
jgi:hypothetical protein